MANTDTDARVTTKEIHKQLLAIANREIARLPEHLEQLTPPERVRFVLAILPYTAPRVEKCALNYSEHTTIGWDF